MKPSSILIYLIFTLILGWNVIDYIREPADDVVISYKKLKTMEAKVSTLMSSITQSLNEPKDTFQLTKNWGSSLTYYYNNYSTNIDIVENNIQSQTYWKEISPRVQDDPGIFKSYCYGDTSLNLSQNRIGVPGDFTVRISWQKNSYCWKQANGKA